MFTSFFLVPSFKPSLFKLSINSSFDILSFPIISIFNTKLDNEIMPTVMSNSITKKIFLFLYLLKMKGIPFFLFIFTLHFVSFAIFLIFLKFLIPMLASISVALLLFIFQSNIFFAKHIFINLSTKYPSTSISKYPNM